MISRRLRCGFRIKSYLVFRRHLIIARTPNRKVIHLTIPVANDRTYSARARYGQLDWCSRRIYMNGTNYAVTNRLVSLRPLTVTGYERIGVPHELPQCVDHALFPRPTRGAACPRPSVAVAADETCSVCICRTCKRLSWRPAP